MTVRLTTHVLDTAQGCPAASMVIDLLRREGGDWIHLLTVTTNTDGRTDAPLLEGDAAEPGTYELVFHAGAYLGEGSFFDLIPVQFCLRDDSHYHVPLLLSPYGYSTYRGS